ncbi:MAG TPA: dicarboxylate/amino acid:cation symporter [Longimicrobiales bacterium]
MSLTARVLLGLAAGLAVGIAFAIIGNPTLLASVDWIAPVGTLWVNSLRMTIIPLVVSGLIMGAASARDSRSIGRLGTRALLLFVSLLAVTSLFTVVVAPILLGFLPVDPAASAALRESAAAAGGAAAPVATAAQQGFPDLRQWLIDLVPTNPIKAATDGAVLPLIVFALAFGIALSRVTAPLRENAVTFFRAVFEAMLTLVRWILELAPFGVFALAVPLAARLGLAAAGAVLYYIIVVVAICTLFCLLLYPMTAAFARVSLRSFARGVAPAQAVAFSARSSLAALPAMIEGGTAELRFGQEITAFFLPLSASTFRLGSAIGIPTGILFVATLYGISLDTAQLLTMALTTVLLTFSVPGVPGGSILIMVPILVSVGLPPEAAGILLGVDTIPDMFRTTTNVTGTMSAATILSSKTPAAVIPSEVHQAEAVPAGG